MNPKDLCLVGAGYWGKNLARNFNALDALHTLCDASQATLDSYGEDYAGVEKTTDFEEVLKNDSIRKVAIAAPAILHYELASRAIQAGKDVYVEKPLCLDSKDGRKLIELANGADRILMVGHLLQYHAYVEKLISMVKGGELGRLMYITSNRLNLGKIRSEENSLWSFAPHDISVILAIAGQMPEQIACGGQSYLTKGVADTTMTQLVFPGGLRSHIYVSWLNPFKEQKLTVVGSQGMAVFDDTKPWDDKLLVYRDYLTRSDGRVPQAQKRDGEPVVVEQTEPLKTECQHFLDCCSGRRQPRTDGPEGLRVLEVLQYAQTSLETGGNFISTSSDGPDLATFCHPSATVDPKATIGNGTKVWHYSHVSDHAVLGQACNIGQNVFIAGGATIGNNVKIQNNVSVYAGTTIEDDVFLGPSCVLTNVSNPRSQVNRRGIYEKTTIRRGATVGANATIVCGTTLGKYAFVAAGAVVTKDVPDYALVSGVPARQTGWMSRHGQPLDFGADNLATCRESGLKYELVGESVRCLSLDEDNPLPTDLAAGEKSYREF